MTVKMTILFSNIKNKNELIHALKEKAVKFYEDKGVLHKIDANGSIDEVWERLLNIVNQ